MILFASHPAYLIKVNTKTHWLEHVYLVSIHVTNAKIAKHIVQFAQLNITYMNTPVFLALILIA